MKTTIFGLVIFSLFFCSVTFAQEPPPKAQRCLNALIAVEDIAKALSQSRLAEAKNIVVKSALSPAPTFDDPRELGCVCSLVDFQQARLTGSITATLLNSSCVR